MIKRPMIDIEQAARDGIDLTNSERKPDETWEQMEPIKKGTRNGTRRRSIDK